MAAVDPPQACSKKAPLIKFNMPPESGPFTRFQSLPKEMQDRIWAASLSDPGMHFLRLVSPSSHHPWTINMSQAWLWDYDGMTAHQRLEMDVQYQLIAENALFKEACTLRPIESNPLAENSYSRVIRDTLANIQSTCSSAKEFHRFITSRPGVLRLIDDKNITMLRGAPDVVFLEYLPDSTFRKSASLRVKIDCPALALIRRVAVRYSHTWTVETDEDVACPSCGAIHHTDHFPQRCPHHLYQFLATSFPNLEQVWLVDYMMLPREKSKSSHHDRRSTGQPRCFRARDRVFYEADPQTWDVKPMVLKVKDWVRSYYVEYAEACERCHHKMPGRVKFGILGCQWNKQPVESVRPRVASSCPQGQADKKRKMTVPKTWERRPLQRQSSDDSVSPRNTAQRESKRYRFGSGSLDGYQFSFEAAPASKHEGRAQSC